MATRCRLCFVKSDRCYGKPSGPVRDTLQAFAATRRYKNAHIQTKYAQKKKSPQIFSCCRGKMPKLQRHKTAKILHISIIFLSVRSLDEFLAVKMQFSSETKCQLYYKIKTSTFLCSFSLCQDLLRHAHHWGDRDVCYSSFQRTFTPGCW